MPEIQTLTVRNATPHSLGRGEISARLPAALFGGFEDRDGIALATPEEALCDYVYVNQASGRGRRRLPELDLPASFSRRELERWSARIPSERLRTRVHHSLERALLHAEYEDRRLSQTAQARRRHR